ncbi:cytidine/deoxycytidylate deaminase family protein [Candidatus Woesearchaeota archaeon]|nr:cytidine/deoxycytidylate deaminase family protein [Candidatus Woesearchaeota archaeon]
MSRPSWDEYFMGIVHAVSQRATCDRGKTGVVIVKNKQILTTGYVGSPIGLPHCDEEGHQIKKIIHEDSSESQHCLRTNHAEINALAQAAKNGIAIDGATLYCKLAPCHTCAKAMINAGIKRVVAEKRYHQDGESVKLFNLAGVKFEALNDDVEKYDKM